MNLLILIINSLVLNFIGKFYIAFLKNKMWYHFIKFHLQLNYSIIILFF